MIEAVGWQHFDEFFRRCDELLTDDGLMLLQAITIDDRLYEVEKGARSFANTHVFPGGCLPSQELIAACLARDTEMRQVWSEDITEHYPLTLAAWRERFLGAWERLRAARLRRALPPPLVLLPELLRGRLPRAADRRRAGALREAGVALTRAADASRCSSCTASAAAGAVWDPVLGLLEAEREVIVLDMPGFGEAPPLPDGIEPTAANLAAAIRATLRRARGRAPARRRQQPRRLGRAGDGPRRLAPPRSPRSPPPGSGGKPLGPRARDVHGSPAGVRPLVSLALRLPPPAAGDALDLRRPPRADPRGAGPRAGPRLDRRQRLRGREPGDAHPRLRPGRATRTTSRSPSPGASSTAWSARRGPSAAPPARASCSSPTSATRRPGTTPSWSPAPCSRAATVSPRSELRDSSSDDHREDREPALAVERLPGRRRGRAARAS